MRSFKTISCILVFIIIPYNSFFSQETDLKKNKESLYQEIVKMDSLLFDVVFNQCKMEIWEDIMAEEFEFYDDRTGLSTSRQIEINAFIDRCSKPHKVIRKFVSTSVDVLGTYGAV